MIALPCKVFTSMEGSLFKMICFCPKVLDSEVGLDFIGLHLIRVFEDRADFLAT